MYSALIVQMLIQLQMYIMSILYNKNMKKALFTFLLLLPLLPRVGTSAGGLLVPAGIFGTEVRTSYWYTCLQFTFP